MTTLLLASCLFAASQPTPEQLLNKVQESYAKGGDLTASFEQVYFDKLRGERPPEQGRLWANRAGKVRWTYYQPVRKDFIYTGTAAYFYEPDNAQVTVGENLENSPLWAAVQFLSGQGDITKGFSVQRCAGICPEETAHSAVLELRPKEPVAAMERLLLVIEPKSNQVRWAIVYDALGNKTQYRFSDITRGKEVPAAVFDFEIPEGVSVLRDTASGVRRK